MSWVKVQTTSSRRMRQCMGDDTSRQQFEKCLHAIVQSNGGTVDGTWYEPSTKVAHVHVTWTTVDQRKAIMYDLESLGDGDMLTGEEVDTLIEEREAAT
ncbi:MAG TPA: hypothetical protein VF190_03560 [Rhodothermales bacterium]